MKIILYLQPVCCSVHVYSKVDLGIKEKKKFESLDDYWKEVE